MSYPGCLLRATSNDGVAIIARFYRAESDLNAACRYDPNEFERSLKDGDTLEAVAARQALAELHRGIFYGDVVFRSDHRKK